MLMQNMALYKAETQKKLFAKMEQRDNSRLLGFSNEVEEVPTLRLDHISFL